MTIEQSILEAVRALTLEQQREVLEHAARLRDEARPKKPFKSIRGLCAGRGISITEEDIAEARREMWGNFPREF